MVEQERYLRPWIQESFFTLRRIALTSRFTDNWLVISVSMNASHLGQNNRTWWLVSGTSTTVNCSMLYSLKAGWMPSCSKSSSEIMLRISGRAWLRGMLYESKIQGFTIPFSTSLISPGGDWRRKLEAARMRSFASIEELSMMNRVQVQTESMNGLCRKAYHHSLHDQSQNSRASFFHGQWYAYLYFLHVSNC